MKTVENNLISILSRLMCKNTKWVKKHLVKDNCSYVHSLSRFPFLQLLILVQIHYFQIMTFIHHAQFIYLQQYCPLRFERKCIGTGTFTFFRPENSDCMECVMFSLPCIKFNLNSGIFERWTATGSKTSYLFVCLDATTFVFISIITLIETICLKICPRMEKVHFRCEVHTPIFHSWNAYWTIYKDKGANVSSTEK